MARAAERLEESVIGDEREGDLSVMLSVCAAGSDKRGSYRAMAGISLPSLSLHHTLTQTYNCGEKEPVVFSSATHE